MTDHEGEPTIRPITWTDLLIAGSVGGVVGAFVKALFDGSGAAPAPWGTGILLAVLAGLVFVIARVARRRLRTEPATVSPVLATRWLAMARTALLGGAGLAVFFALWALASWPARQTSLGLSRLVWSLIASGGAIALAVAGKLLERALVIEEPPAP